MKNLSALFSKGKDGMLAPSSKAQKTMAIACMAVVVVSGGYLISRSFAANNQLFLAPASGTVLNGNTIDVAIHEDSGTDPVNAVQANLAYDQTQLQFQSISAAGSAFGVQAQNSGGSGSVNIARGVSGGNPPVTGDQLVATVTFKALVGGNVTSSITFASGSAVVRSTDNANILVNSAGADYVLADAATPTPTPPASATPTPTPTGTPPPATGKIYISPASGSVTDGNNLSFDVREDSGSTAVNAVQANYTYDQAAFQFVSIDGTNSAFGVQAQSSGSGGQIQIARGVTGGSPAVTGDQLIATVTLQAIGTGSSDVAAAAGSALVAASDNSNVLDPNQTTGGTFALAASGGSPTPTPTPAPTPAPTPTPAPIPVSVTGSGGAVPVKGTIQVSTPTLPDTGGHGYKLDGNSIPSATIDTTALSDGIHTFTVTATSANGTTTTVGQKIKVENHSNLLSPFAAALQAPITPIAVGIAGLLALGYLGFAFYRRMQASGTTKS